MWRVLGSYRVSGEPYFIDRLNGKETDWGESSNLPENMPAHP